MSFVSKWEFNMLHHGDGTQSVRSLLFPSSAACLVTDRTAWIPSHLQRRESDRAQTWQSYSTLLNRSLMFIRTPAVKVTWRYESQLIYSQTGFGLLSFFFPLKESVLKKMNDLQLFPAVLVQFKCWCTAFGIFLIFRENANWFLSLWRSKGKTGM